MPLLMNEHLNPGAIETIAGAIPHRLLDIIATSGGLFLFKDYIVAKYAYALPWAPLTFINEGRCYKFWSDRWKILYGVLRYPVEFQLWLHIFFS